MKLFCRHEYVRDKSVGPWWNIYKRCTKCGKLKFFGREVCPYDGEEFWPNAVGCVHLHHPPLKTPLPVPKPNQNSEKNLFVVTVGKEKFISWYSEYANHYITSGNDVHIFGLYKDAKNCADAVGGQVVTLMVAQE